MFAVELRAIRLRSKRKPGIECHVHMAHDAEGMSSGIGNPRALMNLFPRLNDRRFGVDNKSVEVKNQGFNHGEKGVGSPSILRAFFSAQYSARPASPFF